MNVGFLNPISHVSISTNYYTSKYIHEVDEEDGGEQQRLLVRAAAALMADGGGIVGRRGGGEHQRSAPQQHMSRPALDWRVRFRQ